MTDHLASAPRNHVPGRARRLIVGAAAAAATLVLVGLWIFGRLPGAPVRSGPLEGTNFEDLRIPLRPADTGVLWGSLVLHNSTKSDITLENVSFARNPANIDPIGSPYVWDETRVALLDTGAVSGYQLPLPSTWHLPQKHAVSGYRIPPQKEDGSVEIVYELPVPTATSTVDGITVRYRAGGIIYRKTFGVSITVCPPGESARCHQ